MICAVPRRRDDAMMRRDDAPARSKEAKIAQRGANER